MKRLVVVLALTNVLTLLGLAVTVTVLVMNSVRSTVDEVAETEQRDMQARFAELEARYLAAQDREEFWRDRLREADHEPRSSGVYPQPRPQPDPSGAERRAVADREPEPSARPGGTENVGNDAGGQTAFSSPREPRPDPRATRHDPRQQPPRPKGIAAWRLMWVDYNAEFPARSVAFVEMPGPDGPVYRGVKLQDTADGWTVRMIEPTRVIVVNEEGQQRVIDREQGVAPVSPDGVEYEQLGPYRLDDFADTVDRSAEDPATGTEPTGPSSPDDTADTADAADATADAAEARDPANDGSSSDEAEDVEFDEGTVMTTPDGTTRPDLDNVDRPESEEERAAIEAEDRAAGADVDLPAGVAARTVRHLLTAEQMYAIKTDWRRVLLQALFESHYNSDTAEFDGVRLVNFPKNSIYSLYGFQLDDVIQSVNGVAVRTGSDIDDLPHKTDFSKGATIRVLRDDLTIIYRFIADPRMLAAHEEKLAREEAARREMLESAHANGYPQPAPEPGDADGTGDASTSGTGSGNADGD